MHENRLAAGSLLQTPFGGPFQPPKWWGGGCLPYNLGPSGLAPYRPKSLYQNLRMLRTLTDCLMLVILCRIHPCSTVLLLQQLLVCPLHLSPTIPKPHGFICLLKMSFSNFVVVSLPKTRY